MPSKTSRTLAARTLNANGVYIGVDPVFGRLASLHATIRLRQSFACARDRIPHHSKNAIVRRNSGTSSGVMCSRIPRLRSDWAAMWGMYDESTRTEPLNVSECGMQSAVFGWASGSVVCERESIGKHGVLC